MKHMTRKDWTAVVLALASAAALLYLCLRSTRSASAAPNLKPIRYDTKLEPGRFAGTYAVTLNSAPQLEAVDEGGVKRTYWLVFPCREVEAATVAGLRKGQPLVVTGYFGVNGPYLHVTVTDLEPE